MKTMNQLLQSNNKLDTVMLSVLRGDDNSKRLVSDARKKWLEYRLANGFKTTAKLLTYPEVQQKLGKSEIYSVGLTLQHADVAGIEMCPWRTAGCTATCVLDNGNGRYAVVQHARTVKTQFLQHHPAEFVTLLVNELLEVSRKHKKVLVRLNVNSDLRWYEIIPSFFGAIDNLFFYDYTKNPVVLMGDGMVARNYRLCYSISENDNDVRMGKVVSFIKRGGTAAIVTSRKKTDVPPAKFMGVRVVDGDISDDRYHEKAVFIDLYAKGKARALPLTSTSFVRTITLTKRTK